MTQEEKPENTPSGGLALTDYLLERMTRAARIGAPVMLLSLLLAILNGFMLLYEFSVWFSALESDYYLMEGANLYEAFDALISVALLYLFIRGVVDGRQAFQYLRDSATDDEALLEGNARLAAMLRWFALFGIVFIGTLLLQKLWHYLMS
ncbi:MAG: hypothetical protein SFV22_04930 [Saprospiraceae bacterium]|nr:hypothetical protein [Saprospiraceae bacterium]